MPGKIHSREAIEFYESIGASQRAISILKRGFKLPFINEKIEPFWRKNNQSLFTHYNFAKEKLEEWVETGYALETSERPLYISALSVAPRVTVKDEIKLRLCFDGTFLNDLMITERTKLPTLEYSESIIEKGDYFVTLDLTNCYFHVKLHEEDRDKVAFAFPKSSNPEETEFRFFFVNILIYGLKPATLVIHLLTKPLTDYLANKNIRTVMFIDDIRVNNRSAESVAKDTVVVKNVFTQAGWTFNDDKETSPSQEVYYLGFYYDSETQKYRVHENKIRQVERRIQELEGKSLAKPKEIAAIVGKLIAFELATSYVPRLRCFRYFTWTAKSIKEDSDWHKNYSFPKKLISDFKKAVEDVKEFSGTIRRKKHQYEEIQGQNINPKRITLAGDGNARFGAYFSIREPHKYGVIEFNVNEDASSSMRELLVLYHCVKSNAPSNIGKDLVYYTDSQVLYYWHRYGTANSQVAELLRMTKQLCLRNDVILEVSWRPREDARIELADASCRTDTDDFAMPDPVYKRLCHLTKFYPQVDLFASTLLHKTDIFYSRNPTLGSSGANALNFKWDKRSYCHPPKNLMQEVFRKIETEPELDMMLVLLKTAHDTDYRKFLDEENYFKNYVQMVIKFDSTVHFPGETNSSFVRTNHTWYAMRIVKPYNDVRLSHSDIYNMG